MAGIAPRVRPASDGTPTRPVGGAAGREGVGRPAPAAPAAPATAAAGLTATAAAATIAAGLTAPAATATIAAGLTATAAGPAAPRRPDPAVRFLGELHRDPAEQSRPRPLPPPFLPLASAIVGGRPVHVSTGPASRRALRSVGKRAATTGSTIHLERVPPPDRAGTALVAHELTHVAHPSPAPRFFADERDSPEERRAHEVARIMSAAPVLPRATSATDTTTVRRSIAPNSTAPTRAARADDTVSAPALAARLAAARTAPATTTTTTTTTTGRAGTVQRLAIGQHRARAAPPAPPTDATATTTTAAGATATTPTAAGATATTGPPPPPPSTSPATATTRPGGTTSDLLDDIDRIIELIEERIIVELERRGGRYAGDL